ncbi:hypothetical protein OHA72_36065 [Dactylosporangium sp. NBC_01737]|jgi:hypothetical protein|uniref:hypothetical protein n=1 Tax=Dactylosporangium sp. NBC_01737 TaxID=2975959 RepID=UPI002E15F9E1|nr:hypothetical protein OHA72_36065 [Dactylosporangium sp. NBC_01737]
MNPKTSARILVVLSILYGLLIGLLGALDAAVAPAAIVGAVVLGGLWTLRGILITRHSDGDRAG